MINLRNKQYTSSLVTESLTAASKAKFKAVVYMFVSFILQKGNYLDVSVTDLNEIHYYS